MSKSLHKFRIAIDGGDYCLNNAITSGIKRHVHSFVKSFDKESYSNILVNYYYFNNQQESSMEVNLNNCKKIKLPTSFYASFFLPLNIITSNNEA